jgi:hypothetical protein
MTAETALARDHLTVTETDDGTSVFTFGDKGTGRICGDCQLCCRLVATQLDDQYKPAGVKCQHARYGKGCTIHARRPLACRTWSCRWLADPNTSGMPRPDRCHYVIDLMPEEMVLQPPGGGEPIKVAAVLVYLDPEFPDAHRAPELRAYLLRMAQRHGAPAVVRMNGRDVLALIPPPLTPDGAWREIRARDLPATPEAAHA